MLGKQVGIIRRVDVLGRIVTPKEIRDRFNWEGKSFAFFTTNREIIIKIAAENEIGRKVDGLGRLVIPKVMRKHFKITEDTPLEMLFFENGVILKVWEGLE